jgi:glutathione S-transferase
MSITLYQSDLSPFAARVRIQARVKGLTDLVIAKPPGGTGSAEFKALNPTGKIPALVVDGAVLAESQVICDYLEDRHPTPALWPSDPLARAEARLLARVTDLYVCGPMFQTTGHASRKTRDQSFVDARLAELQTGLGYIVAYRGKSRAAGARYLIGETLTLADAALAPALFFVVNFAAPVFQRTDLLPAGLEPYWNGIKDDPFVGPALDEMMAALQSVRGG